MSVAQKEPVAGREPFLHQKTNKLPQDGAIGNDVIAMNIRPNKLNQALNYDKGPPWWRSQRYILAYLLFGGMMNIYCQRINFSIAIICMINHTALETRHQLLNDWTNQSFDLTERISDINQSRSSSNIFKIVEKFPILTNNSHAIVEHTARETSEESNEREDGPFIWDKELQGVLLGAIYWSYLVLQIPGNHLVRKVKKKTVILIAMTLMTTMTLVTHVAALLSPWAVFGVKLVQGGCTAFLIIAMYGIWEKWAPPKERAGLMSLGISGQMLGNITAFPVSALLCKYGFLGGWPSVFYVFGMFGLLWILLFYLLADDSPSSHKFITEGERRYVNGCLAHTEGTRLVMKDKMCNRV